MTFKVIIRCYTHGDELHIKRLLDEATMSTVWPVFVATARRELVSQFILMFAAFLFVVLGWPLSQSMMAFPAIMALLWVGIWIGHKVKAVTTHSDVTDIRLHYLSDPKCGFWVAEAVGMYEPAQGLPSKIKIIKETEKMDGFSRHGTIIGCIAITFKNDTDNEPHQTVAWLRRMAVSESYRRLGIGSALADAALEHCAQMNFRAIELVTTEHHVAARSLYATKGFELVETTRKTFCGGLIQFALHRLRLPAILVARSNLNA